MHGMIQKTLMFLTGSMTCLASWAQQSVQCEVLRFQSQSSAFIEIHLNFASDLFRAEQSEEGWATEVQFEAVVESSQGIVNYGKSKIIAPFCLDSIEAVSGQQFHLERIAVPPGTFMVKMKLSDALAENQFEQTLEVRTQIPELDLPHWSDPFLVEAFSPSIENQATSILSRSGYEMLPAPDAEIASSADKIQVYAEFYNAHDVVDSTFLISCWLEDAQGGILNGSRRFFKKSPAPVIPVFTGVSTAGIGTEEEIQLVLQATTRQNQLIAENRLPIRVAKSNNEPSELAGNSDIPGYLKLFTDSVALQQHIRDHHPKADASQRKTMERFIETATVEQMQAFLTHFWEQASTENPEAGWRTYTTAIAYADSAYGACRNGHGAETDMGYIYLRYGPPNTVVKRHNETDYYPYEIWHYHRAGPFTNKRFLFYSPHMVAECFSLLHSDMLGEVQNADWLHLLRNRENRLRVIDSQLNRLNPRRDTFSGEEPEDLFFNPR